MEGGSVRIAGISVSVVMEDNNTTAAEGAALAAASTNNNNNNNNDLFFLFTCNQQVDVDLLWLAVNLRF